MPLQSTYEIRRGQIETYFDRTAMQAWEQLTSTAPVGRIRATVRAGRDRMRDILLSWLPEDLSGKRLLDAGCGTGSFAAEAARRGANVVAIDLSPSLVEVAKRRVSEQLEGAAKRRIEFLSGDMTAASLGTFDHVVAMDSIIHYQSADAVAVLEGWAPRVRESIVFTFAPSSPLLKVMHAVGRWFPRSDRAPSIEPVAEAALRRALGGLLAPVDGQVRWSTGRSQRVSSGFYTSQALELRRESPTGLRQALEGGNP